MESFTAVVGAVSTVGFPIVISLILIYFIYILECNSIKERIELRKSIDRNSTAITQMTDKLNHYLQVTNNKGC